MQAHDKSHLKSFTKLFQRGRMRIRKQSMLYQPYLVAIDILGSGLDLANKYTFAGS